MKNTFVSHRLCCLILFLGSCLLYLSTLSHQFTLDDELVLTENKYVTSGDYWSILSKDTFAGFFTHSENSQLVPGGRYRPLTLIIFSAVWTVTQSPWVFHAINVLLYALSVMMLFLLIRSFSIANQSAHSKNQLAFIAAVLFAVHPIHTEVVNNIKGLDDILSLLLALAAWKSLHKPFIQARSIQFIWVMSLMFLALLSKESAVVILPIAFISLCVFNRYRLWQSMLAVAPMAAALLIYVTIRMSVIHSTEGINYSFELMNNPFIMWQNGQWLPMPWNEQSGTVLHVLLIYLKQAIIPFQLSHDYYPHAIPVTQFWAWQSLLALFLHIIIAIYVVIYLPKRKFIAFALAIYLISLTLFSNVFFNIGTLLAERFLYIPSIGICLMLAYLFWQFTLKTKTPSALYAIHTAFILLVMLAAWKVHDRSKDWHDNLSLFEADIKVSPNSAKLNNAIGGALTTKYSKLQNSTIKNQQLKRAIEYLDRAIELHPTYAMPHLTKGNALHYLGQHEAALTSYQQAINLKPGFDAALKNTQKVKTTIKELEQAATVLKQEQTAVALSQAGNHQQAIVILNRLIEDQPSAKLLFFRGIAKAQSEQVEQALNDFKAAEKLTDENDKDNLIRIWQAIINTYLRLNQAESAEFYQNKIVQINE